MLVLPVPCVQVLKPILWTITGMATFLSGGVAWGAVPGVLSLSVAEYTLVVSVSTITAAAGGLVSATNWVLDSVQTKLVADLAKGGYHKLLPGQTYTSRKTSLSLNMRAWVVRIQRTPDAIIIRRCNTSVWSGPTYGSNNTYNVMDKKCFSNWRNETIPIRAEIPKETASTFDEQYSVIDSGVDFHFTEEASSSWIQVDAEKLDHGD